MEFFRACVAGHSPCACGTRSWLLFRCPFFVVPQRKGERKGTRTFPPRLPLVRAKRSRRCRSAHLFAKMCKFSPCVGAWKSKHQHESSAQAIKQKLLPSATRLLFAQISNKDGKAKTFANSKPICGVGYMPRRWRDFAKAKAPPFIVRTAGRSSFQRRQPLARQCLLVRDS